MLESRAERSALGAAPDIAVVDVSLSFLFSKAGCTFMLLPPIGN